MPITKSPEPIIIPQMDATYQFVPPSPSMSINLVTPRVTAIVRGSFPIVQCERQAFGPFVEVSGEMESDFEEDEMEMSWMEIKPRGA